jgi:SAM-dependent methyltransferase
MTQATSPAQRAARSRRELLRLFRSEKTDPAPFYEALAVRTLARFPFELSGARVLDLGCGPGFYTAALRAAGATVLPIDYDTSELIGSGVSPDGALIADAGRLPIEDGSLDGVFCSNLLEHARGTAGILGEIERVLRPGGWAWVSWTNWYSPWGGHDITPFHYLGPRLGLRVHRRLRGEPRKNVPGEGLFPVHVGATLDLVRARRGLRLVDAMPRYYPSQRWVLKVPGLRELATWNCVLVLERVAANAETPPA